jgi:hypothetical protein
MSRLKILSIIIILGNLSTAFSQNNFSKYYTKDGDSTYKYIWKVHIGSTNEKNLTEFVMTGFKIANKPYILTALHGLAQGYKEFGEKNTKIYLEFYSVGRDSSPWINNCEVNIVGGDVDKDLLLLEITKVNFDKNNINKPFNPLSDNYKMEGLKIGNYITNGAFENYGYPETVDPQAIKSNINSTTDSYISKLLNNNNQQKVIKFVGSPNLDTEVISMTGSIMPGLSGAPVVNKNTMEVIGICDGAKIDNYSNKNGIGWAIKFEEKDVKHEKVGKKNKIPNFDKVVQAYRDTNVTNIGLHSTKVENFVDIPATQVKFHAASPRFILGGFWKLANKIFEFTQITGTKGNSAANSKFSDYTIDYRMFKKMPSFMLGAFFSVSNLEFNITSKGENGIPENITESKFEADQNLLGLQTTILVAKGALYHLYGGAGLGVDTKNIESNINNRIFIGYRKYLFHRQRISFDIKATNINTKNTFTLPNPFGNAVPKSKTINQYNICIGANVSIGR